nr:immunoglobulin heavy chain junction region [Macaca mulatta]
CVRDVWGQGFDYW